MAFFAGGALILKRKFSVQEFWSDIHKYDATMFDYIGELCRYLLNAPPGPHERDHHIRAITGNGLRPEIWREFQDRFAIPRIVEFYGATEGNVSMLNYDGTVGAVGRVPDYLEWLLPTRVVRFDVEKEMPVRGPDGLCIECEPDEVGEAIGGISKRAGREFRGLYQQRRNAKRKSCATCSRKGDAWFRTGDLMRRDEHGYFYFVDRIGDTFRWKGENVATSEVAEALSAVPGIRKPMSMASRCPAWMAAPAWRRWWWTAISTSTALARAAGRPAGRLMPGRSSCACQPQIDVTGTFKQRKVELVSEGFDPVRDCRSALSGSIPPAGRYERLTPARYADIVEDRVKL